VLTFCQSENIGYYMNKVRRVMCSESKSFQRGCWHRVSFFSFFEKKKSRACWLAGLNGILQGFNSRKLKCNRQMRSGIVLYLYLHSPTLECLSLLLEEELFWYNKRFHVPIPTPPAGESPKANALTGRALTISD